MDVDTIDIGVEFKHAIESAVSSCDVLFVMIGPRWLTAADSRGERRLSRSDDYVRLEVEAALGRNIRVVPALIAGADMPVANDLPGTLAPLALRNAVEMSDGPRWQYDVSRLMNLLERIRAGESHAEVAPPLETGMLEGGLAGLSSEAARDMGTPRDPVPRGAESGHARDPSTAQPATSSGQAGDTASPRMPAPSATGAAGAAGSPPQREVGATAAVPAGTTRVVADRAGSRMLRGGSSRSQASGSPPFSCSRSSARTNWAAAGRRATRTLRIRLRTSSRTPRQPLELPETLPARTARTSRRTPIPIRPSSGSRSRRRSAVDRASSATPSTPAAWRRSTATSTIRSTGARWCISTASSISLTSSRSTGSTGLARSQRTAAFPTPSSRRPPEAATARAGGARGPGATRRAAA